MGSILKENIRTVPCPSTTLPVYNTTTRISVPATKEPSGSLKGLPTYHHATVNSPVPSVASADILLQRFAQFIQVITASRDVAFVAESNNTLSLVHALSRANVHEDAVPELRQQRLEDDGDLNTATLDFVLCYEMASKGSIRRNMRDPTSSISSQKLLRPLILSVTLFPEEETADITLCLCPNYGPRAAAGHLLNLSIAYLCPKIDLAKTEKSWLSTTFPTPSQTSSTEFPMFLHSILEETAKLYPNNIAIDEVTSRSQLSRPSFERRVSTYSELSNKVSLFADQIEQVLQRLEWPEFRDSQKMIPIFLQNSTELNICMNAISKAGHCFCILQTDAPEDRLRTCLRT